MKNALRAACAAATLALIPPLLAGCGTSSAESKDVTLQVWTAWSGDSIKDWRKIIDRFEAGHPGITVKVTPGVADPAQILAAIAGGNPPDLVTAYKDEELGKYCSTGAWEDLTGRIRGSGIDMATTFSPVAVKAVTFEDRTCGLPYVADAMGLYYNKAMLRAAGFSQPPRTFDQLTRMAEKLTTFNADGSIKVAGFVPLMNFYENYAFRYAGLFGAGYFDAAGKADLASDPAWTDYLLWERKLIDFYGYDKLESFQAKAGDEWTADNAFQSGRVAMLLDGEWRAQSISDQVPGLPYDTAPMPVSTRHPELYGGGQVGVGFGLIPRGAENADAAWELLRFLATDDDALVDWVNRLQNLPTTRQAAASSRLHLDPHVGTFQRIYADPHSFGSPVRTEGALFFPPIQDFVQRWERGDIATADLHAELVRLDGQIDDVMSQAG